jgi:hypothetical protein
METDRLPMAVPGDTGPPRGVPALRLVRRVIASSEWHSRQLDQCRACEAGRVTRRLTATSTLRAAARFGMLAATWRAVSPART